jgi:hypothetical protein
MRFNILTRAVIIRAIFALIASSFYTPNSVAVPDNSTIARPESVRDGSGSPLPKGYRLY